MNRDEKKDISLNAEKSLNVETTMAAVVRLRAMEPEDLDALYRIENDRDVWMWERTTCLIRDTSCTITLPTPRQIFMPTSRCAWLWRTKTVYWWALPMW